MFLESQRIFFEYLVGDGAASVAEPVEATVKGWLDGVGASTGSAAGLFASTSSATGGGFGSWSVLRFRIFIKVHCPPFVRRAAHHFLELMSEI